MDCHSRGHARSHTVTTAPYFIESTARRTAQHRPLTVQSSYRMFQNSSVPRSAAQKIWVLYPGQIHLFSKNHEDISLI